MRCAVKRVDVTLTIRVRIAMPHATAKTYFMQIFDWCELQIKENHARRVHYLLNIT